MATYTNKIVNSVLRVVGLLTVNRVDMTDPDTFDAVQVLEDADTALQTKGYWFNKDYNVLLPLNGDSELVVPSTTLEIEFDENRYTFRGIRIYDRWNQTFKHTEDMTLRTITTMLPIAYTPPMYQTALKAVARRIHFAAVDGDATILQDLQITEQTALLDLKKLDLKKKKVSAVNTGYAGRLLAGMPISPMTARFGNVIGGAQWVDPS